ncbi:biotin transport system substrate-specific component [Roseovarius sp. MBR-78]|uniref:biotin transporter BioY n=1 Tax=Roseovarius sp. MBR-78 TaxID=3156460 RepID=UPI00339AF0AC
MLTHRKQAVLAEIIPSGPSTMAGLHQLGLVLAGVLLLALSAKVVVPMWPVPMTLGTLAVLMIGAVYGPRLGIITIAAYLFCGALGLDVFAGTSIAENGLAYMMGPTGGYLVGYGLAVLVLGFAARAGWDRSMPRMALALLVGNIAIYLPGVLWLGVLYGWDQPILQWGLMPFVLGDALKLCLATSVLTLAWRICENLSHERGLGDEESP